jgi:hypothetical protein
MEGMWKLDGQTWVVEVVSEKKKRISGIYVMLFYEDLDRCSVLVYMNVK